MATHANATCLQIRGRKPGIAAREDVIKVHVGENDLAAAKIQASFARASAIDSAIELGARCALTCERSVEFPDPDCA
jgi:hypothetical protein